MRITLLHPPHTAIGSRVPRENLPPLGLLAIGGPLIDAGHQVRLVNADPANTPLPHVVQDALGDQPQAILIGHSGSTSVHPTALTLARLLKASAPDVLIIYGGVFPSYHWQDILQDAPQIDIIVRGEGEATTPSLIAALVQGRPLDDIPGIAFRRNGQPCATPSAPLITHLDAHRIGWELIDFTHYSYWGGKRAVVMQFSRGCPHLCTYCGQRGFWTRWRHRDPVAFAAEIAWLVREKGVELINLADENPTSSRRAWQAFLTALIATGTRVTIVGSTRADDIVRDADILHLYKQAGCIRFLMGLEGTDEATLATVKKGGSRAKDRQAIQLLRQHGMIGLCTFAVGFEAETDRDYWTLLRHLLDYDPDQIMSVHATPHRWTPFHTQSAHRRVLQTDLRLWDYKHQVLETPHVPAWRVFLWVKLIEATLQLRPRALWRTWCHPDPAITHAMRWYTRMGRRVWLHEFRDAFRHPARPGPTVARFWGIARLPENALALPPGPFNLTPAGENHGHRPSTPALEPPRRRDDGAGLPHLP